MNKLITTIFGMVMLVASTQVGAVLLSLQPSLQTAMPGDAVSLNLTVSGLGSGGSDSLGDFDVDVAYDLSALSFTGYTMGTSLGDIGLGEALDFSLGDLGGGLINLSVVSLLEADSLSCTFCIGPYLADIQPDSFILATLDFLVDVLPAGSSTTVSIDSVNAMGDGFGLPLAVDTSNAVIRNPALGVPEPEIFALMMAGLVGMVMLRRRRS